MLDIFCQKFLVIEVGSWHLVRLMTSFDTRAVDVDAFLADVRGARAG
jgi:threonine aldolase